MGGWVDEYRVAGRSKGGRRQGQMVGQTPKGGLWRTSSSPVSTREARNMKHAMDAGSCLQVKGCVPVLHPDVTEWMWLVASQVT